MDRSENKKFLKGKPHETKNNWQRTNICAEDLQVVICYDQKEGGSTPLSHRLPCFVHNERPVNTTATQETLSHASCSGQRNSNMSTRHVGVSSAFSTPTRHSKVQSLLIWRPKGLVHQILERNANGCAQCSTTAQCKHALNFDILQQLGFTSPA